MRRREVIALITGTAAECLATRVRAQPNKTFRLGILVNTRNAGVDELLRGSAWRAGATKRWASPFAPGRVAA
jgi:hypothetical protein